MRHCRRSGARRQQVLSRSQLKAKFFNFLNENRLIFIVLSGCFQRLESGFGGVFFTSTGTSLAPLIR